MDLVPTEKLGGEIAALRSRREALESAKAAAAKRKEFKRASQLKKDIDAVELELRQKEQEQDRLASANSPSTRPPPPAAGGDSPGRAMAGLQEPSADLVPVKTFSARLGKRKVKLSVDVLGLHVVEDSKKAPVLGTYALAKIADWNVAAQGKNKSTLRVSIAHKQEPLQFESKEAQTVADALQGAKLARLSWLEMQKLSAEEQRTVADFLAQVPLLKACTEEQRLRLAKYTTKHSYAKGELIIKQGARPDGLYIVASGHAAAEVDGGVQQQKFATGDFFGELALKNDAPRRVSVRAIGVGTEATACFRIVVEEYQTIVGIGEHMLQAREEAYKRQERSDTLVGGSAEPKPELELTPDPAEQPGPPSGLDDEVQLVHIQIIQQKGLGRLGAANVDIGKEFRCVGGLFGSWSKNVKSVTEKLKSKNTHHFADGIACSVCSESRQNYPEKEKQAT